MDLQPGQRVAIRVVPDALQGQLRPGREGRVEAVEPGAKPTYLVAFRRPKASGRFLRTELFYVFPRSPIWSILESWWRISVGLFVSGCVIALVGLAFGYRLWIDAGPLFFLPLVVGICVIMLALLTLATVGFLQGGCYLLGKATRRLWSIRWGRR
jgi:hypothetical protein